MSNFKKSAYWMIPLAIVAVLVLGVLALGIPGAAPARAPYEKQLVINAR